jgi:hypothetical protein
VFYTHKFERAPVECEALISENALDAGALVVPGARLQLPEGAHLLLQLAQSLRKGLRAAQPKHHTAKNIGLKIKNGKRLSVY